MKRKIIISVICAIVICGILAGIALSGVIEKPKLSSYSDKALYTVLRIYGFSIPEELGEEAKENLINGGLRKVVEDVEKEPNSYLAFSYSGIADLYENVKKAVEKYYEIKISDNTEIRKLSSLSEEEIYAVLNGHGVIIPDALKDFDIKDLIKEFEEDPDRANPVDYSLSQNLWEDIRKAVKEYYGIE